MIEITHKEAQRLLHEIKKKLPDDGLREKFHVLRDIYREMTDIGINPSQYYLAKGNPKVDEKKLLMFKLKHGIL